MVEEFVNVSASLLPSDSALMSRWVGVSPRCVANGVASSRAPPPHAAAIIAEDPQARIGTCRARRAGRGARGSSNERGHIQLRLSEST